MIRIKRVYLVELLTRLHPNTEISINREGEVDSLLVWQDDTRIGYIDLEQQTFVPFWVPADQTKK